MITVPELESSEQSFCKNPIKRQPPVNSLVYLLYFKNSTYNLNSKQLETATSSSVSF